MNDDAQIPFVLGMFTVSGSPAFPALVLDDEAAISIDAIAPLAARLGHALTGQHSIFGLLQNWERNFAGLCATVMALNDAVAGKYFRSAFTSVEFLTPCAPIEAPRQILCELTGVEDARDTSFVAKLASTVVGPKAKIHLPKSAGRVVVEAKVGVVMGQPAYQLDAADGVGAIAGYVTVTDVTLVDSEMRGSWFTAKSQPSFLPTGPYFVPRAFAGDVDTLEMTLAVNGEKVFPTGLDQRSTPIGPAIADLTQDFQLFPGDIICCGAGWGQALADLPGLGDGDIVETAVRGLGQQTLNSMRASTDV
ncbi:2,4-diketo-3-deoxy-L-fuconate hydrolase [Rhizobium sp. SG_E_25_P2]|uniref:fumarylacetoacetate hydrolase family protein n=1 Tax=Rhizobium sp. SG_E_25_P2 TaxID=2879942 RepID=UPI002472F812|nr:fumarylacetoacetate hydrolase family protein [Rhizobium sp. SG_E_25_P2]MDH6266039.1 2,4-diketo-3-deoxy-L-fuconate hydrolase [Rhizobium sp. SG_E_25_P2]